MKSYSVTIQMKATEQCFPVLLFIILYKVVLTLVCVTIWRLMSSFQIMNKITSASWALVCCCWCWTFIFLSKSSFSERSLFQESLERDILKGVSSVDFFTQVLHTSKSLLFKKNLLFCWELAFTSGKFFLEVVNSTGSEEGKRNIQFIFRGDQNSKLVVCL